MTFKGKLTVLILISCSAFLFSCSKNDKTEALTKLAEENQKNEIKAITTPPPDKPTGKYETKNFQKTYNNCKPKADSCTYIQITFQLLNQGAQSTKINKSITDTIIKYSFSFDEKPKKTIEESMDSFIKEYDGYKKDMQTTGNGEYIMNWYDEETGKVVYDNSSVLSYEMHSEAFTGGAHGSYYTNYYNFDQTTGQTLTYNDIFEKGSGKALDKLIEKKYRQSKELRSNDKLTDGGLFENHIEHNDNIMIFKDGIKFYYNVYEISSYAAGPTELIFSWGELGDLISKNFKSKINI